MTRDEYRKQNAPILSDRLKQLTRNDWIKLFYKRTLDASITQIKQFYEVDRSTKVLKDALEALSKFPVKDNFYDWLKDRFVNVDELIDNIVADYTYCNKYDWLFEMRVEDCFTANNIDLAVSYVISIWLSNQIEEFLKIQNSLLWSFKIFNPYNHTCEGK